MPYELVLIAFLVLVLALLPIAYSYFVIKQLRDDINGIVKRLDAEADKINALAMQDAGLIDVIRDIRQRTDLIAALELAIKQYNTRLSNLNESVRELAGAIDRHNRPYS